MSELVVPLESFCSIFGFTGEEMKGQRREVIVQSHTAELFGRTRSVLGDPASSSLHFSNSDLSCNRTAARTLWSPGHTWDLRVRYYFRRS